MLKTGASGRCYEAQYNFGDKRQASIFAGKIKHMSDRVRVRFAPSPTGPLHIGGVRTALFNYLFAKSNNGDFILRIEDTDQNRFVEGAEEYIIEALEWCGLPYDEGPGKNNELGPYRQSERREIYQEKADELISSGKAYYAFDTPEELDILRSEAESGGLTFIYNWSNRNQLQNSLSLSEAEVQDHIQKGTPYVIRFKSPENEKLILDDEIRGTIEIDTSTLDDKILFKSDGMPTYHLANIVDDHLMQITHVIRGEEWLPSLALHHLLYKAFGWEPPVFAHLPLILKPVGKGKLSKRDGEKMGFPIFPLSWKDSPGYREAGYYPEAVVNYLAMLGWNPGDDQEIFNLDELINKFSLERVHKAGARFDPEKTKWYNHHYLQQRTDNELVADLKEQVEFDFDSYSDGFLLRLVQLLKERANFASEIWDQGRYFFEAPVTYNEKVVRKQWKEDSPEIMTKILQIIQEADGFSSAELEKSIKSWIQSEEIGFGRVMAPLRLAIVGDLKGPHLFDILELLGKEECLARIKRAISVLKTGQS